MAEFNWPLTGGVFLAALVVAGLFLTARSIWRWKKLRRLGAPISYRLYVSLTWRGVKVPPIAAAHWAAKTLGYEVDLDLWVSFALLRVDVVKVASALAAADACGLGTSAAQLGAAALAGYDPAEVVQAAHERNLKEFTAKDLGELNAWGLSRSDKPV